MADRQAITREHEVTAAQRTQGRTAYGGRAELARPHAAGVDDHAGLDQAPFATRYIAKRDTADALSGTQQVFGFDIVQGPCTRGAAVLDQPLHEPRVVGARVFEDRRAQQAITRQRRLRALHVRGLEPARREAPGHQVIQEPAGLHQCATGPRAAMHRHQEGLRIDQPRRLAQQPTALAHRF